MPSTPRLPASGFRAVFFAKRASMRVYPTEPFGSSRPQKSFNSQFTVFKNLFVAVTIFVNKALELRGIEPLTS